MRRLSAPCSADDAARADISEAITSRAAASWRHPRKVAGKEFFTIRAGPIVSVSQACSTCKPPSLQPTVLKESVAVVPEHWLHSVRDVREAFSLPVAVMTVVTVVGGQPEAYLAATGRQCDVGCYGGRRGGCRRGAVRWCLRTKKTDPLG